MTAVAISTDPGEDTPASVRVFLENESNLLHDMAALAAGDETEG